MTRRKYEVTVPPQRILRKQGKKKQRSQEADEPLEGAPVPVARNTTGHGLGLVSFPRRLAAIGFLVRGGHARLELVVRDDTGLACVQESLDARHSHRARLLPALIGRVTLVTDTRRRALRVETSLLVEWDHEGGVRRAVDMAAVTTMVPTNKEAEERTAGW